ncbi:metal-sensing transcriptional repressor [Aquabacterium sp.]|uniref:metal-sensing transcriptional repressor n=1 Tax=Aquabacterium sp. TaxID=1872578 RepID=UPI003B6CA156
MAALHNDKSRNDILNRLKRAEGQLRGIQRMIEEGEPCLPIATQMAAVRKALDSTYVRMTMCFMQQQMEEKLSCAGQEPENMDAMLDEIETLLGKIR